MPNLTDLALSGASCFSARTVTPSITLPAHTSLLRGVSPAEHGVMVNRAPEHAIDAPSFLRVARTAGLRTAALYNWTLFSSILESNATDTRTVIDGGYDPAEDEELTVLACDLLARRSSDLLFTYFAAPDLAGHDSGWDSDEYRTAIGVVDLQLGRLVAAAGDDCSVIVTTDHGGLDKDHTKSRPIDLETFMILRSPRIDAATAWTNASILDVAPTVAELCGFAPDPAWVGDSLLGRELDLTQVLLDLLAATASQSYGETVNMLDHSLQSAALARAEDGTDDLVVAALLHDIGHVLGDAGVWGLPGHAAVGARALQSLLSPAIVEPVRLHVDAKRYLVATEPEYLERLSEASVMSLGQQGGPFSPGEVAAFEKEPHHRSAVVLRRWDDDGKVDGLEIAPLESYRGLLAAALRQPAGANWERDACRCSECRDAGNDQHLLNITDVIGWHVVDDTQRSDGLVVVGNASGETHRCELQAPDRLDPLPLTLWGSGHEVAAHDRFAEDLVEFGIALEDKVPTRQGEVLVFARALGFVRETNYGALFDVVAEADPTNLAYTPVGLPLHTDNPYRRPCPTVQLLHCLESAKRGGASQFSDGFAAADRLRREFPEDFDLLTSTPVTFRYHGDGSDLQATRPIVEIDSFDKVTAISLNHRSMEPPSSAAGSERFYRAYSRFYQMLSQPDAIINLLLQPGQLVGFDNRRVLHARTGFDMARRRHLQGCYIDMDAVQSRVRVSRPSGRETAGPLRRLSTALPDDVR